MKYIVAIFITFLCMSCVTTKVHKATPLQYTKEADSPTRNDLSKEKKLKVVKRNSYRYSHKPKQGYYHNCKYNNHGKR